MWIGDRAWARCPQCATYGQAVLLAVAPDAAPPYVIYRCLRCRRIWKHAPPPEDWRYLEPPPKPLPPPVYQLARSPAESGPWAHGVTVPDEDSGHRALDAYRAAHPDEWVALLVGGSPVVWASPWSEWAAQRAVAGIPLPSEQPISDDEAGVSTPVVFTPRYSQPDSEFGRRTALAAVL